MSLPPPKPYAPYLSGDFRMEMGMHALNLADWIEIDDHYAQDLAEKRRLLAEQGEEVFVALPQAQPGAAETLALLGEHLPRTFPLF